VLELLKVNNINSYYGNIYAAKDITFKVRQGEIITLIGANGAGKSTILKTISGLMHSKTGSISFLSQDISKHNPNQIVKMGLAHVPEGRRVFAAMSVAENLEMGSYTQPKKIMAQRLANVYEKFPRLKERQKQMAGTLSGGEQQMLAMGRAMMSNPTLLMLDEPSMGLAPLLVEQIFSIIKELNAAGVTILLVEQNAQMALAIADRGYVLETGKIIATGTGKELLENELVKKAYLGG